MHLYRRLGGRNKPHIEFRGSRLTAWPPYPFEVALDQRALADETDALFSPRLIKENRPSVCSASPRPRLKVFAVSQCTRATFFPAVCFC